MRRKAHQIPGTKEYQKRKEAMARAVASALSAYENPQPKLNIKVDNEVGLRHVRELRQQLNKESN